MCFLPSCGSLLTSRLTQYEQHYPYAKYNFFQAWVSGKTKLQTFFFTGYSSWKLHKRYHGNVNSPGRLGFTSKSLLNGRVRYICLFIPTHVFFTFGNCQLFHNMPPCRYQSVNCLVKIRSFGNFTLQLVLRVPLKLAPGPDLPFTMAFTRDDAGEVSPMIHFRAAVNGRFFLPGRANWWVVRKTKHRAICVWIRIRTTGYLPFPEAPSAVPNVIYVSLRALTRVSRVVF